MPSPAEILAALADRERLAVAGALAATSGRSLAELADATAIPLDRVQRAIAALTGAGVVRRGATGPIEVDVDALREAAASTLAATPLGAALADHPRLRATLHTGMLHRLPPDPAVRAELLDLVLDLLPPFDTATELEVNAWLAPLTTDVPLVRRELVDSGRLARDADGSRYRRLQ